MGLPAPAPCLDGLGQVVEVGLAVDDPGPDRAPTQGPIDAVQPVGLAVGQATVAGTGPGAVVDLDHEQSSRTDDQGSAAVDERADDDPADATQPGSGRADRTGDLADVATEGPATGDGDGPPTVALGTPADPG
jgi:hypothetical protein